MLWRTFLSGLILVVARITQVCTDLRGLVFASSINRTAIIARVFRDDIVPSLVPHGRALLRTNGRTP